MKIEFVGLPSDRVSAVKRSGLDDYQLPIERGVSDGEGFPCRHCLHTVPEGKPYMTLAWRPFSRLSPFAETGPLYLCAQDCRAAEPSGKLPGILTAPTHILRGYSPEERIVYGTGSVVPTQDIPGYAAKLLGRRDVSFVDVRSASNNCFLCRIRAAEG